MDSPSEVDLHSQRVHGACHMEYNGIVVCRHCIEDMQNSKMIRIIITSIMWWLIRIGFFLSRVGSCVLSWVTSSGSCI